MLQTTDPKELSNREGPQGNARISLEGETEIRHGMCGLKEGTGWGRGGNKVREGETTRWEGGTSGRN